jgi:methylase of polypeptide subunit release factors
MSRRVVLVTMLAVLTGVQTWSQERFSFFAPSTPESVERMLTLAKLRDDDVVVDLGSGNGLIPLTAARMNPRLRGRGVEINPKLVEESNQRAVSEGVADRVRFEHRNAFDVDLRDATVVTMWLFPELMRLLRPVILERAAPGWSPAPGTSEPGRPTQRTRMTAPPFTCGSCLPASPGAGSGN